MKRDVEFSPAFDKCSADPSKNYGIGAVMCRFVLSGKRGAVQFLLSTGWYLPHVWLEIKYDSMGKPEAFDLGYHSYTPRYEGQKTVTNSCPYLEGKPCYYDGSSLRSTPVLTALIEKGSDEVWAILEKEYIGVFGELE